MNQIKRQTDQCSEQMQNVQGCEYHHNHVPGNGHGAVAWILGSSGCDAAGDVTFRYFIFVTLRNFFPIVALFLGFFARRFCSASSGLPCFVFVCFKVCLEASSLKATGDYAVLLRLLAVAFFLGFFITFIALEGISCKRIKDTVVSVIIVLLFFANFIEISTGNPTVHRCIYLFGLILRIRTEF